MPHPPTPQQRAVYHWVRNGEGNLLLIAVAGAGKTTTILNCSAIIHGWAYIAAYNTKIAREIMTKLRDGSNISTRVQAGTFHSAGFRNWRKQYPKVEVAENKVKGILGQLKVHEKLQEFTLDLVSLAKQRAIGVEIDIKNNLAWEDIVEHYDLRDSLPEFAESAVDQMVEDGIGYGMLALEKSLGMDDTVIDYDDMILAPLVHQCRMWLNDWLFVDEAQDTNPSRLLLAKRMIRPGGRMIFVGDPAQAIYGFAGADNDSLDIIKDKFQCTELPLTVTHRCPKAVVSLARQYVKHIVAADTAPQGEVKNMTDTDFAKLTPDYFTKDAVMLCRTTAPLVAQAYSLLRRSIPCHVEGKAIGHGLIHLIERFRTNDLTALDEALDGYLREETEKLLAKGQEKKVEVLVDKVDTIRVLMQPCPIGADVQELKRLIRNLFGDTPDGAPTSMFTLSTVHKAKGREWDTVYLLDRQRLMPSKWAKQQWQIDQEYNLIYVAVTRAKKTLVEVKTTN